MNTDQTSVSVKWEAFRAYFRSVMISYTSFKSKTHYKELLNLEVQIKNLGLDIYQNDSPEIHKEYIVLRAR